MSQVEGSIIHRPASRMMRPPSTRPGTALSNPNASHIIAIYENRGIGREIGIASLNPNTGKVSLFQLADCQTYVKTLNHLHVHYPSAIIVLDSSLPSDESIGRQPSMLVQYIQEEFPDVTLEAVARKYWNDTAGLEFVVQLIVEDEDKASTILSVNKESFALCATSALFKYVQTRSKATYPPKSLHIRLVPIEGTMLIDNDTARNLEICENMGSRKSKNSLFGLLNHVFTPMGTRLLRVNLLAPPNIQGAIDGRLDAVEELVNSEDLYTPVKEALRSLDKVDIDKLIAALITQTSDTHSTLSNTTTTPKEASTHITTLLTLRNVIRAIPAIRRALGPASSRMLCAIRSFLDDSEHGGENGASRLEGLEELLGRSLNDDAGMGKRSGLSATTNKIYALRANFNRMLDVARETYKENVGDVHSLVASLKEEHNLPITLIYKERAGGFWLGLADADFESQGGGGGELPRGFLNVTKKGGKWTFTTLELKKLNARVKDSLEEALMLSDRVIQGIVGQVTERISVLYKASEAISLLDVLWAFAHVSILHRYVRPEFTGTLAIKSGRHPILENVQSAGEFVANDAYACASSTFQIVQGPNMSGKSTYIRQLGLLTVLATCGCFVPAEYASFKLHDTLLTRLSNNDDPERNLSTLGAHMQPPV